MRDVPVGLVSFVVPGDAIADRPPMVSRIDERGSREVGDGRVEAATHLDDVDPGAGLVATAKERPSRPAIDLRRPIRGADREGKPKAVLWDRGEDAGLPFELGRVDVEGLEDSVADPPGVSTTTRKPRRLAGRFEYVEDARWRRGVDSDPSRIRARWDTRNSGLV